MVDTEHTQLARKTAIALLDSRVAPFIFSMLVIGLIAKQLQQTVGFPVMEVSLAAFCVALSLCFLASGRAIPWLRLALLASVATVVYTSSFLAILKEPAHFSARDLAAYSFNIVIIATFSLISTRREEDYIRYFLYSIGIYLLVFVVLYVFPSPLQEITKYATGNKLQGLSDNPNQIALIAAAGLSLCLYLDMRGGPWRRVALPVVVLIAYAGLLTGSMAFVLGAAVTAIVALIHMLTGLIFHRRWRMPLTALLPIVLWSLLNLSTVATMALTVSSPLFPRVTEGPETASSSGPPPPAVVVGQQGAPAVSPVPAETTVRQLSERAFQTLLEDDGQQGAIRLTLWKNAVEVARRSPVLGLGPGTHVPLSTRTPDSSLHEAHNTALDLFVVFGAAGVFVLAAVFFRVLLVAIRYRALVPTILFLAPISVLFLTHFIGRQPMFWLLLFLAASYVPSHLSERHEMETRA